MEASAHSHASAALILGKEPHVTYSKDGFVGPTLGPDFMQNKTLTFAGIKTPNPTTLSLIIVLALVFWLLSKVTYY